MSKNSAPETGPKSTRAKRPPRLSLLLGIWLLLMWVALWGNFSWANIISGIIIVLLISVAVPMPRLPNTALDINIGALCTLFIIWAWEFFTSSLSVAWIAVRPSPPPPSAVITVPLRFRDDITLATGMALINLQPGGLIVDVDKRKKTVTMHILDASSTGTLEGTRGRLAAFERRLIRALENREVSVEVGVDG